MNNEEYPGLVGNLPEENLFEYIKAWVNAHLEARLDILKPTELVNALESDPDLKLFKYENDQFTSYDQAVAYIVRLINENPDTKIWRIRFLKGDFSRITLGKYETDGFIAFPEISVSLQAKDIVIKKATQEIEAVGIS